MMAAARWRMYVVRPLLRWAGRKGWLLTERGDTLGGGATAFGAKFPFLHLLSIPN